MEDLNGTASANARKLLEGERVEVRQKEKGLRGSWHAGVVVQVKFSRRVVEYDELLTLDCLKKLRETIPLYENVKFQSSVLREKNGTQVQQNSRGYIRPSPPPCLSPVPQSWTKGLLVEAFYEDAWWEGILLDDALSDNVSGKVRILFPEEGDELRTFVRNVRVSQEWDEATGQWAVSGHWSDETGDFSSLKQIWRQKRSLLKELWRQRRCSGRDDCWNVEQSKSFSAPISQSIMHSCIGNAVVEKSGNVSQDKAMLVEVENCTVLESSKMLLASEVQLLERHCEGSAGPTSAVTNAACGRLQVPIPQNESFFTLGTLDEEQCLIENCEEKICTSLPDQSKYTIPGAKGISNSPLRLRSKGELISSEGGEILNDVLRKLSTSGEQKGSLSGAVCQTPVSPKARANKFDAKNKETVCEQYAGKKPERRKFSCPKQGNSNTRRGVKARLEGIAKAEVRLTRSRRALEALHQGSGKHLRSRSSRPLDQNLQHTIAADKQPFRAEAGSTECSIDANQTEKRKGNASLNSGIDTLLTKHVPCHEGSPEVLKNNSSADEAFSLRKAKALLMQARLSAKRFLLDAGWHIEFRISSSTLRQEAVYVSPSGSKYFSLASACRGLKKCQNLSICSRDNTSKELALLNTYNIAKGFTSLQKRSSRQMKAGKMISSLSSNGSRKAKSVSPSMVNGGKVHSLQNGMGISMSHQEEVELESSSSVIDNSSIQEPRYSKSKLILCAGKASKRKQNGQDSVGLPEPRCKKSKCFMKKSDFVQDKGSRAGCRMQVLLSLPGRVKACSAPDSAEPSQFKKSTVLSWLIDKGVLKENESVCYLSRKAGHSVKKGRVTREGVRCNCCKVLFTLSNFEAHAGSKLHRPSANIFLNDGRSISDCQMQACALQDAKEKKEGLMDKSDDTCGVCGDGGELILCDHCPSTFHPDCIGLKVIPEGDWYCPRCCCGACGGNRLAGMADNRMHRCAQCELEYHLACVHTHGVLKSDRASRKTWFCGSQCEEILAGLRGLVGISHPLEKGLSWMLLRSMNKDHGIAPSSWEVMAEYNSKLSVAHGVMQECFVPMIDPRTKIDLISQALYNRRSKVTRLNYGGFYTMLLERGDEIISVATIRIHGARLAEMPLVGTRFQYRRQGMCRRLVHALEEMLRNVGVEKLILPAVPELLDTWRGSFRFQEMSFSERCELIKLNLMSFPGTTLLQKHLIADASVRGPLLCRLAVSERIDNLESISCKYEKDFQCTDSASPVQGALGLEACITDQSHASAEGTIHSRISQVEKREPLFRNLHSCLGKFNHLQGELQPIPQDPLCSPTVIETTEGHVDFSLSRGRLKGRIKCKPLVEGPGDALGFGEESQEDDGYNTKVVLTTTRSKRLVKSCRWVADGLKELAKDAKQSSKRTLSIESSVPKSPEVTQDPKYAYLFEECSQRDEGQGNGQMIENVYVRMRRRAAPPLVQVDEGKELQRVLDFSGNNCVRESAVESYLSESGRHSNDETNFTISNRQLMYPLSSNCCDVGRDIGNGVGVTDEALNITGVFGAGSDANYSSLDMKNDSDCSIQAAEDGMLMGTKYYSRRKKREMHEDTQSITAMDGIGATALQISEPSTFFHPSFDHEAQELNTGVLVSEKSGGEEQIEKVSLNAFKTAPSVCAFTSLVPATIERQGVRG